MPVQIEDTLPADEGWSTFSVTVSQHGRVTEWLVTSPWCTGTLKYADDGSLDFDWKAVEGTSSELARPTGAMREALEREALSHRAQWLVDHRRSELAAILKLLDISPRHLFSNPF